MQSCNYPQEDLEQIQSFIPIDEIHSEFFRALEVGPVVVEAPPGCGKSTRLPLWCSQAGRVLVVEPRRLPCRSLACFLACLQGTELGDKVGYSIRFESRFTAQSDIVFVTPGIALRWYQINRFRDFNTVILDEFHERRWDTDLLASLLRYDNKPTVLTSATVQGERLANFLNATRLQSRGKLYPVELQYTEKDSLPSVKNLGKKVADAVSRVFSQGVEGDILVFLPGKGEIGEVQSWLQKKGVRNQIIPLHASVKQQYQDLALQDSDKNRIILSTNVAETSLTIPGVRVVVDSGLEKRTHYRSGRTVLALSAISQAAADQRKGRAGRLGPGKCVRLWGKSARLEPYTPPEVVREDPAEFILAAAACGQSMQTLNLLDPPPEHALKRAKSKLIRMQALDQNERITSHGCNLFYLPLDTQLAHLITAMPDQETKSAMVDLASALSVQGKIFPYNLTQSAFQHLMDFSPESCDALTLLRLVRFNPPSKLPVSTKVLNEARRISSQIKESLNLLELRHKSNIPRDRLVQGVLRAVPELVYVRRTKRPWTMGNGEDEVEISTDSRFSQDKEIAIVFDRHSVPGQRGTIKTVSLATCLAPISFQEISRADLGDVSWDSPFWDGSLVKVRYQRTYAGRVIESWDSEPVGEELCSAVAELILNGQLWSGWGDRIQRDVQAWNLYLRLGFSSGREEGARSWLSKRLRDLGLEESGDIFLLEPKDLEFEGIPQCEREDFDRKYPISISLANLELQVEYQPLKRTITLLRVSGIRRFPPQRWELPPWGRNWSIWFRDGNRYVPVE